MRCRWDIGPGYFRRILVRSGQSSHGSRPPPGPSSPLRRDPMTKRVLFFAYGVVSYVIFFGTFLYAVGFIGGFAVPTRLDGPPRGGLGVALAVDAGLLALFAVQHSVMARRSFKEAW